MKKVKITSMVIRNFKGIKNFEINFNDYTRIFGDNATGKTTLVDAFTWLLFGKDSTDRKDFCIKTLDGRNNVINKLEHEVAGLFEVDGQEVILKRTLREKWVTRRGSENAELQGNETLFFWNDVPLQAGEYQAKVDQIISEQTFKMITSPVYFNALKWQDRRNILTSIAGSVSDLDIAGTRSDFMDLIALMGDKSFDEFKKELAAKRKKLKDELTLIPARVDEVTRNTPESKNWKLIQDEIDILTTQIEAIDTQLQDSSKVYEAFYNKKQDRLKKIDDLKTKISDFELDARKIFKKQLDDKQTAIDESKKKLDNIKTQKIDAESDLEILNTSIGIFQKEQAQLREQWVAVNAEQFSGVHADDCKCYACGQDLPADKVQEKQSEALAKFNANKDRRLSAIVNEGSGINPKIEKLEKQIEDIKASDFDGMIAQQETRIMAAESMKIVSVQALMSGNTEYEQAVKDLNELNSITEDTVTVADSSELKLKKTGLIAKVDELKKQLTTKDQITMSESRKKELLRQEKEYSSQLAGLEKTEFTIQEFTRAKVDMLESKINNMFSGVKFRLFDTQLNGGLVECCDTLIDGVPWSDANNAAKINAGIAIINVLSDFYGQSAPIWIDNSESITSIHDTPAQRIELYVSEPDKQLRIA
ncbi:MAG: AAA family ATPase [Mangrovibacterium sp.]